MNPSTADIVAAIEALGAAEAVVLPNNKNVILAAEQAVEATGQAGPPRAHALGAGGPRRDGRLRPQPGRRGERGRDGGIRRRSALGRRHPGLRATRSSATWRWRRASSSGFSKGSRSASGVRSSLWPARSSTAARERADVLTVLVGEGAEAVDDLVAFVQEQHPELEVEVHDGGQPHYPLLFGAE